MAICPRCDVTDDVEIAEEFGDELGEFEYLGFSEKYPEVQKVKCLTCGSEFFRLYTEYDAEILPQETTGTIQ